MRLIRFGDRGDERPGVLLGEARHDCSAHFRDWDHDFFADDGLGRLADLLTRAELPVVAPEVRWAPPVARPGKILAIGLNYRDHAAESGAQVPAEPLAFSKAVTAWSGPFDPIVIPPGSQQTDWEVELALVIGHDVRYLPDPAAAAACIAGYTVCHDVSERHFQKNRGGQWVKGKSADTFCPVGPCLVSADEIPDPTDLELWLDVNGEARQRGRTADMVFPPPVLVHHLSQFMTLEAGDLITTGTPAGVGLGMQPPQFLQPGDVVELGIPAIGRLRQVCQAAPPLND